MRGHPHDHAAHLLLDPVTGETDHLTTIETDHLTLEAGITIVPGEGQDLPTTGTEGGFYLHKIYLTLLLSCERYKALCSKRWYLGFLGK